MRRCLIVSKFQVGKLIKFWAWMVGIFVQYCECTYATELYTEKWLRWLCIFYHNKTKVWDPQR